MAATTVIKDPNPNPIRFESLIPEEDLLNIIQKVGPECTTEEQALYLKGIFEQLARTCASRPNFIKSLNIEISKFNTSFSKHAIPLSVSNSEIENVDAEPPPVRIDLRGFIKNILIVPSITPPVMYYSATPMHYSAAPGSVMTPSLNRSPSLTREPESRSAAGAFGIAASAAREFEVKAAMAVYESGLKEAEAATDITSYMQLFQEAGTEYPNFAKRAKEEAEFRLGKARLPKFDGLPRNLSEIRALLSEEHPSRAVECLFPIPNYQDFLPANDNFNLPEVCFFAMSCPLAKRQLELSHDAALNYLGLTFSKETGTVTEVISGPRNFKDRASFWKNSRLIDITSFMITRMLVSLALSGCEDRAKATLNKLGEMYKSGQYAISSIPFGYWNDAIPGFRVYVDNRMDRSAAAAVR